MNKYVNKALIKWIIEELLLLTRVKYHLIYSVMQSDWNSFCGDVISDIFNRAYMDEDIVLDKKFEKQISRVIYHGDFIS